MKNFTISLAKDGHPDLFIVARFSWPERKSFEISGKAFAVGTAGLKKKRLTLWLEWQESRSSWRVFAQSAFELNYAVSGKQK